jgi:hypothetical protein
VTSSFGEEILYARTSICDTTVVVLMLTPCSGNHNVHQLIGVLKHIAGLAAVMLKRVAGPRSWLDPDGRTLPEIAQEAAGWSRLRDNVCLGVVAGLHDQVVWARGHGHPLMAIDPGTTTGHETLSGLSTVPLRLGVSAFQAGCREFESRLPLHPLLNSTLI